MTPPVQRDQSDANEILKAFDRFEAEFDALSNDANPHTLATSDVPQLQKRLAALKTAIKEAAKFGTLSGTKRDQTELERCFYDPAVRSAAANFRLPTNSNPLTKNWASELYDSRSDISYYRFGLAKLLNQEP
ncbi:MAG: hypothetical protein ACN6PJ_23080 [Achromobacter sp.]|uniref:hypothetical protein n=1 Tax=Achromobacter sp. TaxID=134375 RepID=UPI003D010F55